MCRWVKLIDWEKDREGRAGAKGKIEGRGTRAGVRPGLHVGWRGTRQGRRGAALRGKSLVFGLLLRALPDRLRWSWHNGAI